jgi:hypothetical protein
LGFLVKNESDLRAGQNQGILDKPLIEVYNKNLSPLRSVLKLKYGGFYKDDFYINVEKRFSKLYAYTGGLYEECVVLAKSGAVDGKLSNDSELVSVFEKVVKNFEVNSTYHFNNLPQTTGYFKKKKTLLGCSTEFFLYKDSTYNVILRGSEDTDVKVNKEYCRNMGYDYDIVERYIEKGYSREGVYNYLAYLKTGLFVCEGKTYKSIEIACNDLKVPYGAIVSIILTRECDLWDAVEYYQWMEDNKDYLEVCSTGLLETKGKEARMIHKSIKRDDDVGWEEL